MSRLHQTRIKIYALKLAGKIGKTLEKGILLARKSGNSV